MIVANVNMEPTTLPAGMTAAHSGIGIGGRPAVGGTGHFAGYGFDSLTQNCIESCRYWY